MTGDLVESSSVLPMATGHCAKDMLFSFARSLSQAVGAHGNWAQFMLARGRRENNNHVIHASHFVPQLFSLSALGVGYLRV